MQHVILPFPAAQGLQLIGNATSSGTGAKRGRVAAEFGRTVEIARRVKSDVPFGRLSVAAAGPLGAEAIERFRRPGAITALRRYHLHNIAVTVLSGTANSVNVAGVVDR